MFIHPMWHSETERLGMQKCTPAGYAVRITADGIGFFALLWLLVSLANLPFQWLKGAFFPELLWMVPIAFGIGGIDEILYRYSLSLAKRKGFHYDYAADEASWFDAGQRHTYKWARRGKPPA